MLTIKLPELGEGVTEGELVRWLIKPGDEVKPDQPVAEFMTDKATVEVPSPIAGKVKSLKFKEGDTVKVESVIVELEATNESPVKVAETSHSPTQSTRSSASPELSGSPANQGMHSYPSSNPSVNVTVTQERVAHTYQNGHSPREEIWPPPAASHVLATPATRRLARELGVDINQIVGTGLAGRVTRDDVLAFRSHYKTHSPVEWKKTPSIDPVVTLAEEERIPLRGIRRKIAENMQNSKRIIPHFTLMDEAIVTELVTMRESLKEVAAQQGIKLTYLPLVIKALIATCREFPMFNASIDDEKSEIVYKKYFHVGFAADTPNGLVVPVVKEAHNKSILEIAREIQDLSQRARENKLKPEEMKGATITVTNIGSVGGTYATPIINHPEVAILGMYKIMDKITLNQEGQIAIQKAMNFTITADHRLIDGAVAARFLRSFIEKISQPSRLLLELR
ncbi:MAG: 2-oxo acid dehydrogenase subunit E2 [Bdellovibrionaceae bacterium]|nr:2-oxo acid dehydrogenase subunit E2 [Pseudobdellovibrionaceae bacterium]MDW8190441.1 dihydrolipoamide acetyltransferase family protein [Pseudobdellovibrionaceae bacterium]